MVQLEHEEPTELVNLASQASKIGIWEWEIATNRLRWDARCFAIYGIGTEQSPWTYDLWAATVHPADRDSVLQELSDARAGKVLFDSEFRINWPNGEIHTLHALASVVHDDAGSAMRMAGVTWDVTDVRLLTEQLREGKVLQAALERERLYEHERKWSMSFQRASLPLALPQIFGVQFDALYEPGFGDAQVGGDWYDAVRLIDGRVLITIGDVAGSGLEAAIVVGVVRQIMRGIAQLHADPALILDAADRALALEYPDVYVTAWIGILDPVTRSMVYSCAGHPPPLLVSPDGCVRELGHPTLPIGLREGLHGVSNTVSWSDDDTLILYTDGLTEAARDVITGNALVRWAAETLGPAPWHSPAEEIKRLVIPDGSRDDVAILVVRVNFTTYDEHVDRWRLDVRDAAAATMLRKQFATSLPDSSFSADDVADAELVFGELVGNVVRHVPENPRIEIAVDHNGPRTVLHVIDGGRGFRYVNRLAPDPYSERGRGQFLISAITADFQVDKRADGGSHARAVLQGRSPRPFRELVPAGSA